MTADARRGGSGWRARGRKRRRTENFPGTRLAPVSMSRAWGRARRPGGIGTPRGGGNAQGGNRAVCPQSGENSDGLIPFSGEPRRTVAPLFSALVPAMDATLAIMAARPLYCALPEGLMTTHQRAREVAAEVARHEKTRLFLNDREIWRAVPAGGHTCETTSPGRLSRCFEGNPKSETVDDDGDDVAKNRPTVSPFLSHAPLERYAS